MPSALSTSSPCSISRRLAVDVGQRQRREHAEAAGMVGDQLRRVVVALARDAAALRVVADPDAGRGDRGDGGRDASLVHVLERALDSPGQRRRLQQTLSSPRRISAARCGGARRCGAASRRWSWIADLRRWRRRAGGSSDRAPRRRTAGRGLQAPREISSRRRQARRATQTAAERQSARLPVHMILSLVSRITYCLPSTTHRCRPRAPRSWRRRWRAGRRRR